MRTQTVLILACTAIAVLLPLTAAAETGGTAFAPGDDNVTPQTKAGRAGICQIGPGLGSTLLFPYVEVDLADPNGVTTLISVNNWFFPETLVRLVMWTDWGIPTLAFDIYLKAFDVQTINVRDLLAGMVPVTGVGADLSSFPYCDTMPPTYSSPALTPGEIAHLRTAHIGQPGHIDGLCYGADHGDQMARGFITVDVVDECSDVEGFEPYYTPANTSYPYFMEGGGSLGIAIIDNRLWGDVVYVDFSNDFAQGSEAVSLWADPADFTGSNVFTFYGRHSGNDGRDERVPLPNFWVQRFLNGGPFAGGADLIVFQQPANFVSSAISCLDTPSWWPLETVVVTMDEDSDNFESFASDIFDLVTQRVPISAIGPSYDFGWVQIGAGHRQMWVQPSLSAMGRFSAGFNGFPFEFLCDKTPPVN